MTDYSPPRLVLVAGEASGDQLGADLARGLIQQSPGIELAGVAGPAMQAAGVKAWHDIDELGVMGLTEVLAHLPRLIGLRRRLYRRIIEWQPHAFVGIDAPDFNLGLARRLKKSGLKTVHYVSPTVWAWRPGRTAGVARSVNLLLTLFPFEPELYTRHGLNARFVGHPLADQMTDRPGRTEARAELGWQEGDSVIALLPGSRSSEIARHAELLGHTAACLRQKSPDARLVFLLVADRHEPVLRELAGSLIESSGAEVMCGQTRLGLIGADCAVVASGTATMEAFLLECPLVAYYRLTPATYWLLRGLRLVRSRHIAMPNILYGDELIPEFVQQDARPEQLCSHALGWLSDPLRLTQYRSIAASFRRQLAAGASDNAARAILELVGHDTAL